MPYSITIGTREENKEGRMISIEEAKKIAIEMRDDVNHC